MMDRVAKQVREETGGAVEIQTFPAGQLGSSRDLIEATSSGAIQIVDEGAAQFGQFVPQFSILEAPYIWRDPQHVRRVLSSPILDEMNGHAGGQALDAHDRLDLLRQAPRDLRHARRSTPSTI